MKLPLTEEQRLQRSKATLQLLLGTCEKRGMAVSGDYRVSETDATALLGYAEGSLKQLRSYGNGPPFYKRTVGGSRISYRLNDLADWLEDGREDF